MKNRMKKIRLYHWLMDIRSHSRRTIAARYSNFFGREVWGDVVPIGRELGAQTSEEECMAVKSNRKK